jgi:aryl-alcohol dehydrogenase-like predicted oxidoreductase
MQLSVVGLGGAWLGHDVNDTSEVSRATAVLRAVAETGVNWVDTSENYFDTGNEAVIGAALREMPDSFLVCSKVAPGPSIAAAAPASGRSRSAERVR